MCTSDVKLDTKNHIIAYIRPIPIFEKHLHNLQYTITVFPDFGVDSDKMVYMVNNMIIIFCGTLFKFVHTFNSGHTYLNI